MKKTRLQGQIWFLYFSTFNRNNANSIILPQGNLSCSDWLMTEIAFDRIKYLSNRQPKDMRFIPHLGFICPTQLGFAGYNHLDVGKVSISNDWLLDKL